MNLGEYAPLLIPAGYALAVGLLVLGVKTDPRAPLVSRLAYAGAGLLGSTTTLFWLTLGTFSGPFMYLWTLAPVVVVALVWIRRYRQGAWMDRLAGRTGTYWTADRPGRPSFGVLPAAGRTVPPDDSQASFAAAIEAEWHGHQLLGVQYEYGQSAGAKPRGKFQQAISIAEGTYHAVELRTPDLPAIAIIPRSGTDRVERFSAAEAGDVRPFEDARLTRNTFGALSLNAATDEVDGDAFEAEFSKHFIVQAEDEAFARLALTPDVQRHILADPWFRVREVCWQRGALWTSDAGQLTEAGLFANARHLAMLAAAVPGDAWRHAGAWPDVERFISISRATDTSTAAWYRGRRSLTVTINERRIAANRVPLTPWWIVVRTCVIVLCLALIAAIIADPAQESPVASAVAPVGMLLLVAIVLAKVTFHPKAKHPSVERE